MSLRTFQTMAKISATITAIIMDIQGTETLFVDRWKANLLDILKNIRWVWNKENPNQRCWEMKNKTILIIPSLHNVQAVINQIFFLNVSFVSNTTLRTVHFANLSIIFSSNNELREIRSILLYIDLLPD